MALGGFAPLPLRLGGNSDEGLTAQQHARLSADLTALIRSMPFAAISFQTGSVTPYSYIGQNGVGLSHAPTITTTHPSNVELEWDNGYSDEYGIYHAVQLHGGNATYIDSSRGFMTVTLLSPRSVKVVARFDNGSFLSDSDGFLVVW